MDATPTDGVSFTKQRVSTSAEIFLILRGEGGASSSDSHPRLPYYRGPEAGSEPETQAVMRLAEPHALQCGHFVSHARNRGDRTIHAQSAAVTRASKGTSSRN